MPDTLEFRVATEDWELDQVNRLNYETFVEEIPQHELNSQRSLTDKFHDENTYIICVSQNTFIGMLAIRSKRPFSLDQKLDNLNSYLPKANSICEIRLLSVRKKFRYSKVCYGLLEMAVQYCKAQGHDMAVISGLLEQQKLYEHLGFLPFGPVVGTAEARFQPMYLTPQAYAVSKASPARPVSKIPPSLKVLLTPGPVEINSDVRRAFNKPPVSHRSDEFLKIHKDTKKLLCDMVNSKYVEIFMASGTLANDVIAGQLSLLSQKGLILSNGEFGQRLITQAERFNLSFETLSLDWRRTFNCDDIKEILHDNSDIRWLWTVHCETSTGILNDLPMLKEICKEKEILLCMDCVSSIGTAYVDLHDIYLASGVSGKGLGAFSGLSMVFYNHPILPSPRTLPAYLDLALYSMKDEVPFTITSNLVYALHAALKNFDLKKRLKHISALSSWLKNELRKIGLNPIIPDEYANPFVITINLPEQLSSVKVAAQLEKKGFFISYKSSYLLKRNWIQLCLIGELSEKMLKPLLKSFQYLLRPYTLAAPQANYHSDNHKMSRDLK